MSASLATMRTIRCPDSSIGGAGTGYSVARVEIDDAVPPGNHVLLADQPVGLAVRGVADLVSYWYPGGFEVHEPPQ